MTDERTITKASVLLGIVGMVGGVVISVVSAALFLGEEWALWKEIRDEHKADQLVNVEPDLNGLVTADKLEAAINSLSLDTRYYGAGNRSSPVRPELHDDCATGFVYIGPNRPDIHGGFCVRIVSE